VTKKITINIDNESAESIDGIVAQFAPFIRSHTVAVAALRVGLETLSKRPARLLDLLRDNNVAKARG
jgi:hypothetical protein